MSEPSLMDNPSKARLDEDLYTSESAIKSNSKFTENTSDEDLCSIVDSWVRESRTYHDEMLSKQNEMVEYYKGNQTDLAEIPAFNSNSVYNRIYEATETIVPVVTGSAHQFLAVPGEENELSMKRALKVQKVLSRKYEDLEIVRHLENTTRDIILKRFGVLKPFWNVFTDDVDVKTVDPRLILIPKLRMDANDVNFPYIIELQEYTKEEVEEFFPDTKVEDLVVGQTMAEFNSPSVTGNQNIYQVLECWTPEYVVWKQREKILKRMPNPYFDFEGIEEEETITKPNGKVVKKKYKRLFNHLDRPAIPYIFLNPFTTGDAPVAEASLAEICKPIQDDINTQKRQIINNLIRMGNGQIFADAEALSEEQKDAITSEPGLIIMGKNLASENRIRREPGTPLPAAHFSNLQESIVAFDNVFGTHGALRGASTDSTLGGQILNRQQDLSRVEQLTRCLNRGVARLADFLVQMMKMYYDTEHLVKIVGNDGAIEFVSFTRNDIDDGMIIDVKSGIPPSLDPVALSNQAIQLWQLNALDPETLYERLQFPNPKISSQKLLAWKQGQLLFESELRMKEQEAGIAAKAELSPESGGAGRGAETPNDAISRVRASLSGQGGAPLASPGNGQQSVQ